MVFGPAPARSGFFAAMRTLIDGRPRTPLRFLLSYTAVFVSFLDVLRLTFLFTRIGRFIAAWHGSSSGRTKRPPRQTSSRGQATRCRGKHRRGSKVFKDASGAPPPGGGR